MEAARNHIREGKEGFISTNPIIEITIDDCASDRDLSFTKMSSDSKMRRPGLMQLGSTTLHPIFQVV
jgi:hypothetical protein